MRLFRLIYDQFHPKIPEFKLLYETENKNPALLIPQQKKAEVLGTDTGGLLVSKKQNLQVNSDSSDPQ